MLEPRTFYRNYDILATTYIYGKLDGPNQGHGGVELVSASTTVNATVSGIGTFSPVAVGDFIWFMNGEAIIKRKVATKPSNDQITIDSTPGVTKSVAGWYFQPFKSGTADTDGWVPIQKFNGSASILVQAPTIGDAGGFTLKVEIKGFGLEAAPVLFTTKTYTQASAPTSETIDLPPHAAAVRVGLKGTSGFAGTDDISVSVIGQPK